jgi:predicted nucleic acid-binding protein
VYAFEKGGSPKKHPPRRVLTELTDTDRLRLSTQVLQELFVILTRKAAVRCSGDEALAVLEDLPAWPLTLVD